MDVMNIKIYVFTNKGHVRENNQDALYFSGEIVSCENLNNVQSFEIQNNKCFVVIDGMGGYSGGEIAANIVAESFSENYFDSEISTREAKIKLNNILENCVKNINENYSNSEISEMGAALAGIIFCSDGILIFNVGDCRVYGINDENRENKFMKISHDHSMVQKLYDRGRISADKMRFHKRRNIITSYVSKNILNLDIFARVIDYDSYEKFFICSDGVWEALALNELENLISHPENLASKLLSPDTNCNDNVSFIIAECF